MTHTAADPARGQGTDADEPGESGGGGGDGEASVAEFLDALDTLDSTTAHDMHCPDAIGGMVDHVIEKGPQQAVHPTES